MSENKPLRVFVSRQIPKASRDDICQSFANKLSVEWDIWPEKRAPSRNELQEHLFRADAAITLLSDDIDSELMDSAKNLKILANYAVGHNNIDLEAAKERNIVVTNTPDVLTEATADLAFSLLLSCTRKLLPASENASSGAWNGWEPQGFLGMDLRKKTLGIVGMGRIGQEMARLCHQSFDMRILYTTTTGKKNLPASLEDAKYTSLGNLLKESDVVSLHCPLTKHNMGLFNAEKLEQMKENSFLINTARGELIETQALLESLQRGKFQGVGLDVTDPEPLPANHRLYSFSRVLITPHIGSATHKARNQMADLCYKNILRYFAGENLLSSVVSRFE